MGRRVVVTAVAVVCVLMVMVPMAAAQQASAPTPLRVKVTLVQLKGEIVTEQIPLELIVNTGGSTRLQMTTDVPMLQPLVANDKSSGQFMWQIKHLGQTLQASAADLGEGRFRVDLSFEDTRIVRINPEAKEEFRQVAPQTISARLQPILRDGQTVQHAMSNSATDARYRIDVTVSLVK